MRCAIEFRHVIIHRTTDKGGATCKRRVRSTDADGHLDPTFGDAGVVDVLSPLETISFGTITLPGSVAKVRGLGVTTDGSIVAYSQAVSLTGMAPILLKMTPDGVLDATSNWELDCSRSNCLRRGSLVELTVYLEVPLSFIPALPGIDISPRVRVSRSATARVSITSVNR